MLYHNEVAGPEIGAKELSHMVRTSSSACKTIVSRDAACGSPHNMDGAD